MKIYTEEKLRELIEIRKMNVYQILCSLVMGSLIKRKILSQGVVNIICKDVGPRFVEILQAKGLVGEYESNKSGLKRMINDVCKVMGMEDVTKIEEVEEGIAVFVKSKYCKLCIRSVDESIPRTACIFPKIFEAMANHLDIPCCVDSSVRHVDNLCKVVFKI